MKTKFHLVSLSILLSFLAACDSETGQQSPGQNKEVTQQVFLIGNGPNSKETITDLVEKSEIRKGGYVVIIPTGFKGNNKNAWHLKNEFYNQNIMSVHILNFRPWKALENSDVVAIENAKIVCILNGNRNKFMRLANKTRLKAALEKAKTNGTLITGFGNGASILGDSYFHQFTDPKSQEKKLVLKSGLGLLKNTLIDDITLLKNYWKRIRKETTKKNFTFIGMGYNTSIWIKDAEAVVLSKNKISIMPPDTTVQRLGDGAEFRLLPQ